MNKTTKNKTTKNKITKNKDKPIKKTQHHNGLCYDKNGWKFISVFGSPKDRGYAYGYFSAKDFSEILEMVKFTSYHNFGETWDFFIDATKREFQPKIEKNYPELFEEITGIAEGCTAGGTPTSPTEILTWNLYITLSENWYSSSSGSGNANNGKAKEGGSKDRCSAFIAVGDYTTDGKIVVGHNSFVEFIDGQYFNYIVDILPDKGNRIIMQTCPCWIWSGSDFFVTSAGILGTETTIGGFLPYENNIPIPFRIRHAMQYGNTLDDYVSILLEGNSGDYANSWLFADTKNNEIMLLELGLKYHHVDRTQNGYFIGFNAPYDARIRNKECNNTGFDDIRRHQGSRRVRLTDLMEENKGKINVDLATKLIADHYDVYLKKNNPCSRTVCSHYNLDAREFMSDPGRPKPFAPRGAVDGCVADSKMIENMGFLARYGSSCGTPFNAHLFCDEHRQWRYLEKYLRDRPTQEWSTFYAVEWDNIADKPKQTKTKTKTQTKTKTKKIIKNT